MEKDKKVTALYCRLSKDDGSNSESLSIRTQKSMLMEYATRNGFGNCQYYVDDGYSGTNSDRPAFQELLDDIREGKVATVITKDQSRLGRNHIETGTYMEIFFPEHGVRYIAINDGYDSNEQSQMDIAPFRNIINEMYAKDTSRKIKSALRTRKKSGKYISSGAPFGYQKDPADHNHLVIDPNTAPVVEYIYSMAEEGLGLHRIAKRLHDEKVLKPCYYKKEMFGRFIDDEKMYDWDSAYISQVLHSPVYAGHIIYEAKPTVSMKSKKRRYIPFEERAIVPNQGGNAMRLKNDTNTFAASFNITPPYQMLVLHSKMLLYPRELYQRGVQRKRVEMIAADFNEYVANEPKVSFRNGKYYVVDGQHTIEGRILRNGGKDLPILCKVYTGLTMEQEALFFAEQNGHSAPLTAGIKLRAKVVGGDAPSRAFLAATNRVGLAFNYDSLQLSDYRISCVGTALKLYNQMGEKIYCESLRLIVAAWDGKPDSFRASVLRGMMHFVELYHGEFSEERLVRALSNVHPMEIYRVGRDNPAKLPGWKKYVFPIYMAYNGKGRKDALPMKF